MERLEDVFVGMGFTVSEGPMRDRLVQLRGLKPSSCAPARSMFDTLYLDLGERTEIGDGRRRSNKHLASYPHFTGAGASHGINCSTDLPVCQDVCFGEIPPMPVTCRCSTR